MANSTTNLDTISSSQASKEITANALFDAGSPATLYGRRASTTANLTWGYYGGMLSISGVPTAIANGTVVLSNANTNYVTAARTSGNVTANTANTSWNDTANHARLYSVVTAGNMVSSYTDSRAFSLGADVPVLAANMAAFLSSPSSANLAATVTDETGTGVLVFSNMPTLVGFNSSAAAAISVTDNTNAALTLTQLGTGNALLVEDSTSPDATPTVIDAGGRIITGHTAIINVGGVSTRIQNHDASGDAQFRWVNDINGTVSFKARSRSATIGSFAALIAGDAVHYERFYADDGTAFVESHRVAYSVTGTPSAGNMGGSVTWTQRNTAGMLAASMILSRDGNLSLPVGGIKSASATAGIGYSAGAGGVVTQATNKSTGVTSDHVCGDITMNAASLAADTTVSFTFTNSALAAGDTLNIYHNAVGAGGSYNVTPFVDGAGGSAVVYVRNVTAGALAEAIVLRFSVIKGVTA